ncbi:MAG: hypothetical protein AAF717_15660 [Bacteroidota bacterium]
MSEKSLDNLITTLKSEAIEAANNQAAEILANAKEQAQRILKVAEDEKAVLLQNAKMEAEGIRNKGESALQQAARDLTISLHTTIRNLFKAILEKEVEAAFTPDLVKNAILKVAENVGSGVALELPEALEEQFTAKIQLGLQASDALTSISGNTTLKNGFSIVKTDQGWSYHFTPDEVAAVLHTHLSPKWMQLLKNLKDD